MRRAYKRAAIAVAVAVAAAVGLAAALTYAFQLARLAAGYKAKTLCSGIFVSGRDPAAILRVDVSPDDSPILGYVDARADRASREVSADLLGLAKRRAVYRPGRGCTLVGDGSEYLAARAAQSTAIAADSRRRADDLGWPSAPHSASLEAALDWAFAERDPARPRLTRAVLIVHKGRIAAERYAPGFTARTPLIGWSMTKSAVSALVGILVKQGKISVDDPVPIAAWQAPGDRRARITWSQLLRMSSGLSFDETYANPFSDVVYMLFGAPDAAAYALGKPLAAEPGTRWSYSSGTSNVVAYAIRRVAGESDYLDFPRRALFDPLGMTDAVLETDASGNFVGSSFMYATARDWARLGLLYLHDGVWAGRRMLPEGWVAYTRTPAPAARERDYGAHWWLRIPSDFRCDSGADTLPADAFHAVGHAGQFVSVVPSRDLVVVRLGLTRDHCAWDHQEFLRRVLEAITSGGGKS